MVTLNDDLWHFTLTGHWGPNLVVLLAGIMLTRPTEGDTDGLIQALMHVVHLLNFVLLWNKPAGLQDITHSITSW